MPCPCCNQPTTGQKIGQLGNLRWYRCVFCGVTYSKKAKRRPKQRPNQKGTK